MSLVLDANLGHKGDLTHSTSRNELGERQQKGNKGTRTLRLDSPTTIEACKELGILVEDLRARTIEEFKDNNAESEITELRFNHYYKRYTQNVKDVWSKKREINKQRQRQLRQQQQLQLEMANNGGDTSHNGSRRAPPFITGVNITSPPNGFRTSFTNTSSMIPAPLVNSYSKTMAYLRTSHETPGTKDFFEFLGNESVDEAIEFDEQLAMEVNKFNKLKRQKQKEAKDQFEGEMRRVKTVEDMKLKEKRREEREKKYETDLKKQKDEKKKKAEDKLEKIRQVEESYQEKKLEDKRRMQDRLEANKRKLAEENEERAKQQAEYEQKLEAKKREAELRRERIKMEELEKCESLKRTLEAKVNGSSDRHAMTLFDKTSRVKQQITKIEENVKNMKKKQELDQEEFVQTLVEKLVKKEESCKAFQHQQMLDNKKREKEIADKNKKFLGHQSDLKDKYEERMNDINDRFRKVQENLAAKREAEEKAMRIRQESTKLKIIDKQENYLKKQRQVQYERQKILDRQKYNQEKLQWLKNQREILQQAKVEVSIQSKIERDRIEMAIQQLSKLTSEVGVSSNVNDQQKKILKEILRPEDFKEMEDEERRREEERLELEEARKAGNNLPPVVKAR